MESYHTNESSAIGANESQRTNPYLPPIGRVLEYLWSCGPDGTTITTTVRDLSHAAHCAPSRIPAILRTLEYDGLITFTTSPRGHVITLDDRRSPDGRMIAVAL